MTFDLQGLNDYLKSVCAEITALRHSESENHFYEFGIDRLTMGDLGADVNYPFVSCGDLDIKFSGSENGEEQTKQIFTLGISVVNRGEYESDRGTVLTTCYNIMTAMLRIFERDRKNYLLDDMFLKDFDLNGVSMTEIPMSSSVDFGWFAMIEISTIF